MIFRPRPWLPRLTMRACSLCLITLLATAACDEDGQSTLWPEPTENLDPDGDGFLGSDDLCPHAPENQNGILDGDGCPDSLGDLYRAVQIDAQAYWSQQFAIDGLGYSGLYNVVVFSGTFFTPCGQASGPYYCGINRTMYLDTPTMEDQLRRIGDFAVAIIIAHELGHHNQLLLGALSFLAPIARELQADCYAGRWAASANVRGLVDPGDIAEAAQSLFEYGDPAGTPWFHPAAHGTPAQRVNAFRTGLSGYNTCAL